jgi:hypothetical protein
MPAAKDIKKVVARRTVWEILRKYVDLMMGRFPPPEELLKRVEEKLPDGTTSEARPPC